ncbi:MAG: PAS domain S-box protein [Gallionella sp.]|nr:PAS domain S-box protein [Gallionella sp.]
MTSAILIIEDSIDDQRLYQRALKNCDYSLVMAPTAEIALALLPDLKPDLIMLDYKLPDLDGLSFLKKLAEYSHAAIPILMLTGEGSEAVAVEAMKNGADDYLVKDTGGGYLRLLPGTIERVLNAHAQRVQTQRLQALHKRVIDTSIDGFWMTDLMGNLLEANESYARISGYPVKELVGMHISQLEAMEQSSEEVQTHIAKTIAQGHDRFETRHRHKDGHEIDIEVSVTCMTESQRLCVFCRDITESKRAEEVLRKSENRFRTLVENAPLCIHEIGRDGRLTSMNRAGLLMMGARDECEVQGFYIWTR